MICKQWKSICDEEEAAEIQEDMDPPITGAWERARECQKNAPGRWRRRDWDLILDAIDDQIAVERTTGRWKTERKDAVAFRVARKALRSVCPNVPLPRNQRDVVRLSQSETRPAWARDYWDSIWGAFYTNAWSRVESLLEMELGYTMRT